MQCALCVRGGGVASTLLRVTSWKNVRSTHVTIRTDGIENKINYTNRYVSVLVFVQTNTNGQQYNVCYRGIILIFFECVWFREGHFEISPGYIKIDIAMYNVSYVLILSRRITIFKSSPSVPRRIARFELTFFRIMRTFEYCFMYNL